ncbi:hypothetical protein PENSTE_c014G04469 [Penicillium steckii]|uniref:Mid2 domain-containing protein n=1 Tax=Penicillium steckii TaxID=303698 RepID=A0A1V6T0S3_9EURO|nr:hypothetical protein PENSTE_c014G04469 [Penicillium steckii]
MAHHGHWRDTRVSRLLRARSRLEAIEEAAKDDNSSANVLANGDPDQNSPPVSPDDIKQSEVICDSQQAIDCRGKPNLTEDERLLSKRQEAEPTQNVVVETVLQVVDTNSHTLWQSEGIDFPLTLSDPAFGAVTLSAGETAFSSEPVLLVTSPTALPTALALAQTTNPANSTAPTTQTVSPTTKSMAAASSPKVSSAISSTRASSIPMVSNSTTSAPTTSASILNISSSSSSISSTTSFSSSSTSSSGSSNNWYGGSSHTSTDSGNVGSAPTNSSDPDSSSGSDTADDNTTSKIVGGVVGSVAGVALLLLLILFFFRRRSLQKKGTQTLPSSDSGAREVAERRTSKDPLFNASYLAPAFVKRWRQSTMSTKTESTVSSAPSERGFQKISGRKIPPVLTHGGDGFGGAPTGDSPTIPDSLIGLSPSSPGGPLSSPSHAPPTATPFGMPLDTNVTREAEENATPPRSRQVNLPVSSSVTFGSPTTVNPSHAIPQPQSAIPVVPPRKDALGRSLPSYDGSRDSRGSRFTESLDL